MSLDATRWAWKVQDIRPAQKLVLLSLADRAGVENECAPSISLLSADTGLDRKTIIKSINHLQSAGLISVFSTTGLGNVYLLNGVVKTNEKSDEGPNERCAYCGATGIPLELDHIFPKSLGGGNSPDNFASSCKPCNVRKGSKLVSEWMVSL